MARRRSPRLELAIARWGRGRRCSLWARLLGFTGLRQTLACHGGTVAGGGGEDEEEGEFEDECGVLDGEGRVEEGRGEEEKGTGEGTYGRLRQVACSRNALPVTR
jgi:hypothetical protein